jgi:hypothetical protein
LRVKPARPAKLDRGQPSAMRLELGGHELAGCLAISSTWSSAT